MSIGINRMHPWTKAVYQHMLKSGEVMCVQEMIKVFGDPRGIKGLQSPWDRIWSAKYAGLFMVSHKVGGISYYKALPKDVPPRASKFSDDDKLRRLWPVMGVKCADQFPERKKQVQDRATALGLKVIRTPKPEQPQAQKKPSTRYRPKKPITYFGELAGFRPTSVFELARFV